MPLSRPQWRAHPAHPVMLLSCLHCLRTARGGRQAPLCPVIKRSCPPGLSPYRACPHTRHISPPPPTPTPTPPTPNPSPGRGNPACVLYWFRVIWVLVFVVEFHILYKPVRFSSIRSFHLPSKDSMDRMS